MIHHREELQVNLSLQVGFDFESVFGCHITHETWGLARSIIGMVDIVFNQTLLRIVGEEKE